MEKIKVYAVGRFGVKTGFNPDVWMNYSKGITAKAFVKGSSYDVETADGPKGKVITALKSEAVAAPVVKPVAVVATPVATNGAAQPMKFGKALSEYEIAQEQRLRRSGVIQAALQSPALSFTKNKEEAKDLAIELAELALHWVEKA